MDTHGKTILITGATGNQGGATARHLLADGWHGRGGTASRVLVGRRRREPEPVLPGAGLGTHRQVADRGAHPLKVLWDHSPEAAKVFTWANETYLDTDLAPLRAALGDLMDFGTWLERSGRARLSTQLEALPA